MGVPWLNLGQILKVNAKKYPNKIAFKEKERELTFSQLNLRVNRLAHALLRIGLKKGDKISCLLENCVEIVELYLATAKTGIVINPVNFRLIGPEIEYIANNSDAKAFIVHEEFCPTVNSIKGQLKNIKSYIAVGEKTPKGYQNYEELLTVCSEEEPEVKVAPEDTWVLLYTSGTTGKPKGVLRSHESYVAFYLINSVDFGFTEHDICLNILPLCHVNSTFFSFSFTYIGSSVYLHPSREFDPIEILKIIEKEKITFISLIPTHYNLILNVPEEERKKYDVSSIKKLLCSSAPARKEIKKGIMEFFKGVELYEGYGSTEAGIVTVLKPHEQLTKLGSIGRESCGTDCIKLLDEEGNEIPIGQVGELYSKGPMLFDGYYKMPEKTKEAFQGEYFTARDMAKQDEDGYYYLVDRKDNMIITGGEHIYPSEIEEIIAHHPKVFDVAVIGVPDEKWGEEVKAVVILKDNETATEQEIIQYCKGKMAGFKKPKSVDFIAPEKMPRTSTGKILHRELRKRYIKNETK
ncbi:MAG: class I adenylate-forming enzyme family protein [Candidatus Aminicenantia bacterium]